MTTYKQLQRRFERTLKTPPAGTPLSTRRLPKPNWLDDLAEPFARWLLEAARPAGYVGYETGGPCGIGARFWITLTPANAKDGWRDPRNLHVTVEPSGTPVRLAIVDHDTDTGRFPHNSLGAISGLNHPATDIADDATAAGILAPLLASLPKAVARPAPVQQEMFT